MVRDQPPCKGASIALMYDSPDSMPRKKVISFSTSRTGGKCSPPPARKNRPPADNPAGGRLEGINRNGYMKGRKRCMMASLEEAPTIVSMISPSLMISRVGMVRTP